MKVAVDAREVSKNKRMAAMKINSLPDTITVRTTNSLPDTITVRTTDTAEVTLLVAAVVVVTLAAEAAVAFVEDVAGGLLEEAAEATFEAVEEEDAIEYECIPLVNLCNLDQAAFKYLLA
jgi:hypothetical protein